ncbi:MAG: flavodoxin-dependent (E)-4-hydroxy-3-methylbut-2-enyl-diphosphate synthase, partial [Chloroflexi bacterium]|nr:flavodoxin-dependent (E)-4-hydroxy-3-methylbut-2-enyl-diphosphate synthase [Chloroflexota bacterium]
SNPKVMIAAYRLLAARMADLGMTYPFHLGVTEAGNGEDARIKSAVGIGSLLADGIGDTIRVSLAEEPEAEIPVAFALARWFPPRQDLAAEVQTPHYAVSWDPYHYSRRNSAILEISEVAIGAAAPIAVMARPASSSPSAAAQVMRWTSPGIRRLARPELVEWLVENDSDVDHVTRIVSQVKSLRTLPLASGESHELPRIGHVATSRHPSLLQHLSRTVDAVLWRSSSFPQAELDLLCRAAARGNKRLWLEADLTSAAAHQIILQTLVDAAIRTRGRLGTGPVLSLYLSEPLTTIHSYRLLATLLHQVDLPCPVLLRYVEASDPLLTASFSIGSLLCDGIGDLVLVQTAEAGQYDIQQTLNVLQGAGARLSKTDYVACPSCGRTLFDLQTTTDRIKQKTSHLVGVKIAIMGCVVNGPGEMADADFGYVGGSPGQVNLYVRKTCVERNVPAEVAGERLIALIKEHGRWREPEPAEDEAG